MMASANNLRSVRTLTFRILPSTALCKSRHTYVVKYWYRVSRGRIYSRGFYYRHVYGINL